MNLLDKEIRKIENSIIDIRRRLYFFEAFQAESRRLFDDKTFEIKNDILWILLNDSYEMLIIHFSGLVKGLYLPGGFFDVLKQNAPILRLKSWKRMDSPVGTTHNNIPMEIDKKIKIQNFLDKSFKKGLSNYQKALLMKLFPGIENNNTFQPSNKQIEFLKNNFITEMEPLIDERDNYRAHRYEINDSSNFKNINLLSLEMVSNKFLYLESLMNDIRLLCTNSTFGYSNMCVADVRNTAEDFIDLLQIGSINNIYIKLSNSANNLKYHWQKRENWRKKTKSTYKSRTDEKLINKNESKLYLTSLKVIGSFLVSFEFSDSRIYTINFSLVSEFDTIYKFPRDYKNFEKVTLLDGC